MSQFFEATEPHIIYTLFGFFVCLFGVISLFVKEKLYIGEAVISTTFGIIIGPACLGVFTPLNWSDSDIITLELTRVIIAIQVFAVGVELPKAYLRRHWSSIAVLLVPIMGYGWVVSAALIDAFVPKITYLQALVIAACVTPTDPILAASVVGKGKFSQKHVPAHLRHLLSSESGINDGMAFPFLFLAIYLIQDAGDPGHAVGEWFYLTWAYQIILGTILGSIIGIVARKGIKFAERRNLIDKESFFVLYVSLALASIGAVSLLGSDDLLASFFCGTAFAWDGWFSKKTESSNFSDVIDLLLNQAIFIYIGATIPWDQMNDAALSLQPWRLVLLAICILLVRRIPAMVAMYPFIKDIKSMREAIFAGHFGPIGVGAIFIATLAKNQISTGDSVHAGPAYDPNIMYEGNQLVANLLHPVVYFLVLSSIIVHGATIPLFYLGKRINTITRSITHDTFTRERTEEEGESWWQQLRRGRPKRIDITTIGSPQFQGPMPDLERGPEEENLAEGFASRTNSGSGEGSSTAAGSSEDKGDEDEVDDGDNESENMLGLVRDSTQEKIEEDAPMDHEQSHQQGLPEHTRNEEDEDASEDMDIGDEQLGDREGNSSLTDSETCMFEEGTRVIIERGDGENVRVLHMQNAGADEQHVNTLHIRDILPSFPHLRWDESTSHKEQREREEEKERERERERQAAEKDHHHKSHISRISGLFSSGHGHHSRTSSRTGSRQGSRAPSPTGSHRIERESTREKADENKADQSSASSSMPRRSDVMFDLPNIEGNVPTGRFEHGI